MAKSCIAVLSVITRPESLMLRTRWLEHEAVSLADEMAALRPAVLGMGFDFDGWKEHSDIGRTHSVGDGGEDVRFLSRYWTFLTRII